MDNASTVCCFYQQDTHNDWDRRQAQVRGSGSNGRHASKPLAFSQNSSEWVRLYSDMASSKEREESGACNHFQA